MSRRRHEHGRWHDLTVALVAATAVIWTLLAAMWLTGRQDPAPTPGSAGAVTAGPGRAAHAVGVSRSNARTAPPTPPTAEQTRAAATDPQTTAAPQPPSVAPAGKRDGSVAALPPLLALIRAHESGGHYTARNATGCEGYGCGGAYQLHARYAAEWAARAGYPGMGPDAATWPRAIQDAVAVDLYYSTTPDGAAWCRWAAYC